MTVGIDFALHCSLMLAMAFANGCILEVCSAYVDRDHFADGQSSSASLLGCMSRGVLS